MAAVKNIKSVAEKINNKHKGGLRLPFYMGYGADFAAIEKICMIEGGAVGLRKRAGQGIFPKNRQKSPFV
ncbi:MAG: hypothetical protein EOM66_02095 [Clostridia bacterium]|nr:hypothetical protein [Clostridia bacterium]